MAQPVAENHTARRDQESSRAERLEQLERIVSSSHFRNSKRYPSFLRFVVERTVEENSEVLKERNLGTEVFGRASDYDTNADPIVRVTAGEVRKRIAQYYQTPGHEHELRIDLPLGSYVPHFYPAHQILSGVEREDDLSVELHKEEDARTIKSAVVVPISSETAPEPASKRKLQSKTIRWASYLLGLCALVAAFFFGIGIARNRTQNAGINYFWQAFSPSSEALIVIGVHFHDSDGKIVSDPQPGSRSEQENVLSAMVSSEMVPVSDIVSYSKLTNLLTRRSVVYRTKAYTETTLEELRQGPVILIGGLDNSWTLRLTSSLRFHFMPRTETANAIQDSEHPSKIWNFDNMQPALGNSRDYAIVASYYDTTIEQHVQVAAGIGMNGTMAAAEFLTSEKDLQKWLADTKLPPNRNVELLLSTEVLGGKAGPPHVIAYYTW